MRTLKILMVAVVSTSVLYSCQKADDLIVVPPLEGRTVSLEGSYLLSRERKMEFLYTNQVQLSFHLEGEGEITEFGRSTLVMDHIQDIRNMNEILLISEGSFTIWNENGTELYGEYIEARNEVNATKVLHATINGGTGAFTRVIGSFTIALEPQDYSMYAATIKGDVFILKNESPSS